MAKNEESQALHFDHRRIKHPHTIVDLMPPSACPFNSLAADNVFRRWDLATDGSPGMIPFDARAPIPVRGSTESHSGEDGDDLIPSARQSWRNSLRCVGRLHWRALQVYDARSVQTVDEVFDSLCQHLETATNGGNIRPVMTVFPAWRGEHAEVRIWNHQAIRYAGHGRLGNGNYLGDPANEGLTRVAKHLGWQPPATPGNFDVLPLVIQAGGQLELRTLPRELVLEVPLRHPRHGWLEKLGLRWHAVPLITDMIFATEAAAHPCAPFNGWYMGTEIGSRNLGDETRYAQLRVVAEHLGLDSRGTRNLWRDHALLVLNEAVLYSFERDGVKLVDHHQATEEFEQFCQLEARQGREASADWTWIVPPMAGSATPVFHRTYPMRPELPNLLLQAPAWSTERGRRLLEGKEQDGAQAM